MTERRLTDHPCDQVAIRARRPTSAPSAWIATRSIAIDAARRISQGARGLGYDGLFLGGDIQVNHFDQVNLS